jgi:hypothetical protein
LSCQTRHHVAESRQSTGWKSVYPNPPPLMRLEVLSPPPPTSRPTMPPALSRLLWRFCSRGMVSIATWSCLRSRRGLTDSVSSQLVTGWLQAKSRQQQKLPSRAETPLIDVLAALEAVVRLCRRCHEGCARYVLRGEWDGVVVRNPPKC